MAVPVVIATNGLGVPVNPVESNAPSMQVAANGRGVPIVISEKGSPFIVQGLEWSPDRLFYGGLAGYWAGGYIPDPSRPMAQRIFQDPAGTIPAILPGQPVGLVKRMAGDVNATQDVALAKPTLVRWPATGRRNLANGAQDVAASSPWPNTFTSAGVVMTKVGTGVENGVPYCDIRFAGTPTNTFTGAFWDSTTSRVAAAGAGHAYAMRADVRLVAGSIAGVTGIRARVVDENADLAVTAQTISAPATSGEYTHIFAARTSENADTAHMRGTLTINFSEVGVTVDVTFRIKGVMFERGLVETPLQINYGPDNITEPGVPDRWHLYNDGGDSLESVLPAGTYGTAHLIADGSYAFGTMVSDGVTPITTIPNDRQVDCIYRLGAFTTEEQADILAYWQRKYPL